MKRASVVLGSSSLVALLVAACGGDPPSPKTPEPKPGVALPPVKQIPEETHLADVKQLTLAGENAEAYWAFGGRELVLQSRTGDNDCDRIYRMPLSSVLAPPAGAKETVPSFIPVSSGKGATTCSYFMPGDQQVIYASTHLGGDACPPKPDHSQGYVWALYARYDIFKCDGRRQERRAPHRHAGLRRRGRRSAGRTARSSSRRLRDGDIELYRMDADGKNVQRLTNTPGYDGGAFFNADCSKIVWRASRPKPGKHLDDFKRLLAQSLVAVRRSSSSTSPTPTDATRSRSPTSTRRRSRRTGTPRRSGILFSTNYGEPEARASSTSGRVNIDGTGLERITTAGGFDGFPMFSPDGKPARVLVEPRDRAGQARHERVPRAAGSRTRASRAIVETGADRIKSDVSWLADPAREGRGVGLAGLEASGKYIEDRMKALGLAPAGDDRAAGATELASARRSPS